MNIFQLTYLLVRLVNIFRLFLLVPGSVKQVTEVCRVSPRSSFSVFSLAIASFYQKSLPFIVRLEFG